MNQRQKLVQEQFLNDEEAVIKRLKSVYNQSLKDINKKVFELDSSIAMLQKALDSIDGDDIGDLAKAVLRGKNYTPQEAQETIRSMLQSKVYQKNFQAALQKQVGDIFDKMQDKEYKAVSEYLTECYENGFIGTMYDLQGQGIPLAFPLDQEQMVRAVQLDSKISKGLYTRLGEDISLLKKKIAAQVSRGISTGMSYQQVAQQLAGYTNIGYNNAVRIARTEGHRIQCQAGMDACEKAKEKGADVVKQWDSTLDDRTRESHAAVDGEIREIDKPFSNGLMFPGDPNGGAAEVINCRCALLQRARWALDEAELDTLKERAAYYGLDKTKNFEDYKQKYLKVNSSLTNKGAQNGKIKTGNAYLDSKKRLEKHEIDDCYNTTNPKYSTGREYKVNCQRCVSAYEARRRGIDVVAKAAPKSGADTLPYMMHAKGWANVYENGLASLETLAGRTAQAVKDSICRKMAGYGDGARAIIRVRWSRGNSGHVFIAEQANGVTQFVDPQSGNRDASYYFNSGMIKPSETRLLRIDDKKFTDLIEECAE